MSKKTTYRASAFGTVVTRTSTSRVYTHAVVSHGFTAASAARRWASYTAAARNNVAYYTEALAADNLPKWTSREQVERDLARVTAQLAELEALGAEGYVAREATEITVHGWCGRLDLAQKLAAQAIRNERLDVTIVEVEA